MSWTMLQHLGNLTLTLPLAAALAGWLLAAGERRASACWLLLFAAALCVVGVSKLTFLGWGISLPAFDFKAFSGHAAGVSAVYPMLFHQLSRRFPAPAATLAAALGYLLGVVVAFALVATAEHTAAEAWGGWCIGCAAAAGAIRMTHDAAEPRPAVGLACSLLAFVAASWAMQQARVGYWMVKVALALSGNTQPFHWDSCD